MKNVLAALLLAAATGFAAAAPLKIAIFGNNNIATFLGASNDVTVVSDAQLATSGYLDPYDLFIYTRDKDEKGSTLTAAAATGVKNFVTGNIVLFTSDLQDGGFTGSDDASKLLTSAVTFASNKGYIGELIGACAAMTSNNSSLEPLGLVAGICEQYPYVVLDDDDNPISRDPMTILQPAHPVVQDVDGPLYLGDRHETFARLSGVSNSLILAQNVDDDPSIVGSPVQRVVPEPASLALLALGFGALALVSRRRSRVGVN